LLEGTSKLLWADFAEVGDADFGEIRLKVSESPTLSESRFEVISAQQRNSLRK
jgi:hypothetical protein